eukprot:COSAG04_NODE_7685_length_1087_cov_1.600202_2_plen_188_part_01
MQAALYARAWTYAPRRCSCLCSQCEAEVRVPVLRKSLQGVPGAPKAAGQARRGPVAPVANLANRAGAGRQTLDKGCHDRSLLRWRGDVEVEREDLCSLVAAGVRRCAVVVERMVKGPLQPAEQRDVLGSVRVRAHRRRLALLPPAPPDRRVVRAQLQQPPHCTAVVIRRRSHQRRRSVATPRLVQVGA